MKIITLVLLIFRLAVCPAFAAQQRSTLSLVKAQHNSLAVFEEYLQTSNWHLRKRIASFTGTNEISASRIYSAFEIAYTGKTTREDDFTPLQDAWQELLRNPDLTMGCMRPILFERLSRSEKKKMEGASMPYVGDESISGALQVYARIAAFEVTTNALRELTAFTLSKDPRLSRLAKSFLEGASEFNWRVQKAKFLRDGEYKVLEWFSHAVLKQDMTKGQVEMFLGKPHFSRPIKYRSSRGEFKYDLVMEFWLGKLVKWGV